MKTKQKHYEALVRAFHADIYRYAYWLVRDRNVAEDLVQETFLRAWKSLDSLNDMSAAKSWLITIVRRENARRFEKKQLEVVDIDSVSVLDDSFVPTRTDDASHIEQLLGHLAIEYREPLILQLVFGLSGDEIAAQLGLNKNTVMTRLFRARNQIKAQLENEQLSRGHSNG